MKPRATAILVSLVLAAALALPAQSDDRSVGEETPPEDLAEQIQSLRQAIATMTLALDSEDGGREGEAQDLIESLGQLQREIDRLLAQLTAGLPEVQTEVGTRVSEAGQNGGEVDTPTRLSEVPSPAIEPVAEEPAVVAQRLIEPPAEAECEEFKVFDSNEDGVLSGLDRYWRYFRLWRDDGDGVIEESELSGLYDAGVGEVTVRLGTYRTVDGIAGDVIGGGNIRFDLLGKNGDIARLTLDADRLARGGELELQDGSGFALTGRQALTSQMIVAPVDGTPAPLSCP